ncbi:protein ABHD8-like [Dreissena polymorpha]|uniref:acylglycerol lipase n=1 Tax=Dreissena polymorpha TaxID=45954 RepID=A0A9D4CSP1_DREPO|nr:protein ABHD8-like [Dreissena polymorpha]KAH3730171.1 hypothetical protein DPMN_056152 [Dreissena polymorpha]
MDEIETTSLHSRHSRRVAPSNESLKSVIEIRNQRKLHIRHVNPRERDEKFNNEMQAYMQYRENALLNIPGPSVHARLTKPIDTSTQDAKKQSTTNENIEISAPNQIRTPDPKLSRSYSDTLQIARPKSETEPYGRLQVQSPSHSNHSTSAESVSNVHLDVRPNSFNVHLDGIVEKSEEELSDSIPAPKSARSPRRTKGHRPVSAKNLNVRSFATSVSSALSDCFPDLDEWRSSHKDSPFKDVTLFFIHGVGGSADIWNPQIEFFGSLGLEIVAPDLIGHGLSPASSNAAAYHFKEILSDMEAMFDKYCKRENIIIGHSYGCAFAAALGRRRVRRVTKLVLASGGAPVPLAPQTGLFSLPVCFLSCLKPCIFNRFERNAFHNTAQTGESRQHAFDVPVHVLRSMMQGQDWLDGDALFHEWLTMPILLLHGKYDSFVTLEEEQEMHEVLHKSELVIIDNASHMVMMESPQEVNKAIYEFVFQATHEAHEPSTSRTRPNSSKSTKSGRMKHPSKQLA